MPRIHHAGPLHSGQELTLQDAAARHVQVLRLQPGDALTVFGDPAVGGEFEATVLRMGRREVALCLGRHHAIDRAAGRQVHLAVGMPANERMDWLVEKATELGVASVQPLMTERSVLRLSGERAARKQAHWQAIAVAACEQCGANRVPVVHDVLALADWTPPAEATLALLSLAEDAQPLRTVLAAATPLLLLSGPEGGLSQAEESAWRARGALPLSLGARTLRAETAALAALAALNLGGG